MFRFVMSCLGNASVALSPDLPDNVLHPLTPPWPCAPPAATYIGANGAYTAAVRDDIDGRRPRRERVCDRRAWRSYRSLRMCGLPVEASAELSATCARAGGGMQLHQAQSAHRRYAPVAMASTMPIQHQRAMPAHQPAIVPDAPELWPLLTESAWIQGCVRSSRGDMNDAAAHDHCSSAAWHVARLVLPEYAERVPRGRNGAPLAHSNVSLPVLALGQHAAGCDPASALDAVLSTALPQAVTWAAANAARLPILARSRL